MAKFIYNTHEKDFNQWTEFEVHSEAYSNLKKNFIYVRANYDLFHRKTLECGIVDILIKDHLGKNLLVVEVKKNKNSKKNGKQQKLYEKLAGCPCIYIMGMEEAERAIPICEDALGKIYAEN